jgi:hypothetical protein
MVAVSLADVVIHPAYRHAFKTTNESQRIRFSEGTPLDATITC